MGGKEGWKEGKREGGAEKEREKDIVSPAVSHSSNFTVVSSRQIVCVRKAAPIVLSWYS